MEKLTSHQERTKSSIADDPIQQLDLAFDNIQEPERLGKNANLSKSTEAKNHSEKLKELSQNNLALPFTIKTSQILKSANKPDKPFVKNDFSWLNAIHSIDKYATYTALFSNFAGAFTQIIGVSDELKAKLSKIIDLITNLSFIPYGLDGIRIGAKEKKNPYQSFGFFLELFTVWLTNLKMKYLIRGAGTGTDQIWVATDEKLKELGIEEGRFDTWADGFIKVPQICFKMLKEIIANPIKTIFSFESKGHNALISSIGDIISTLGFAITRKESIFGPIRDISAAIFDWELLLSPKPLQKLSGMLFILESVFDFLARFMPNNSLRLFMNHISIGSGRAALMCYKNSDPNANKNKI